MSEKLEDDQIDLVVVNAALLKRVAVLEQTIRDIDKLVRENSPVHEITKVVDLALFTPGKGGAV